MEEQRYNNLIQYLQNPEENSELSGRAKHYTLQHNLLYKVKRKTKRNVRVIRKTELIPVLYMFHNDPTAAHASTDKIMGKIRGRYYWPQMYEDIRQYVQSCDSCQRRGKWKREEPLHPIPVGEPFHQIGIDYVGPLPRSTNGNRYIIVAMDYLTKWPEARATKEATADETVKFIYEDIICRHGCPGKILSDRGTHFNNQLLTKLTQKFQIQHLMSTPYHPQTNGLVERFNRTLIEGLSKIVMQHVEDWDKYIAPVLFAYRTSKHSTTKITPFFLVYGREAKLPTDDTKLEEERSLVTHIATQIDELPIVRHQIKQQIGHEQQKQKDRHDAQMKNVKMYNIGDKVLYYRALLDKQWSGKLEPKWKGPYYIHAILGNGAYKLCETNGKVLKAPVNGTYLKIYKELTFSA